MSTRIALGDLFAAAILALGAPPEDDDATQMMWYQAKLIDWLNSQLKSPLDAYYERKEVLKLFFQWYEGERLMQTIPR